MNAIMTWMESSIVNKLVMGPDWTWPLLEILHFVGLCLLLGSLIVVDLRVLGVANNTPLGKTHDFAIFAVIGFAINAITGVLFVFGDPFRYFPNPVFQMKMALVVFALLNAVYFERVLLPKIESNTGNQPAGAAAKIIAVFSLLTWVVVIVAGRLIPFFE